MGKDWETRFHREPLLGRFNRLAGLIAGAYWALIVAAFPILQLVGFDMISNGAILRSVLTLPSSVLMLLAHPSLPPDPGRPFHDPLVSSLGTFFLLPVICGGVSALAIYGSAVQSSVGAIATFRADCGLDSPSLILKEQALSNLIRP